MSNHSPSQSSSTVLKHNTANLKQVKLLKHLTHENIIGLSDILRPPESEINTFTVRIHQSLDPLATSLLPVFHNGCPRLDTKPRAATLAQPVHVKGRRLYGLLNGLVPCRTCISSTSSWTQTCIRSFGLVKNSRSSTSNSLFTRFAHRSPFCIYAPLNCPGAQITAMLMLSHATGGRESPTDKPTVRMYLDAMWCTA